MNALAAISPLPFIPITVELPSAQLDVAPRAVLHYFEAERADDKREEADAFDHLVAICYRAVQLYFLRDRPGSLTVIGLESRDEMMSKNKRRSQSHES